MTSRSKGASAEGLFYCSLTVKHRCWCFNNMGLALGTADVLITARPMFPCTSFKPPSGLKARHTGRTILSSSDGGRDLAPGERAVIEPWFARVGAQAWAHDGAHIFMQEPGIEELADDEP